jgi:hypothetical protein
MYRRIGTMLLGAALLFLVCGCIEGTQTITLNPDGSGKVTYDFMMASNPLGPGMQDSLDKLKDQSVEQFVRQKGVAAWKDVSVDWMPDGRLHYVATAYFAKIDDLQDLCGMHLMKGEGSNSAKIVFDVKMSDEKKKQPPPDLAKLNEKELDEYIFKKRVAYQAGKPMVAMMFTDLKVTTLIRLPGAVGELKGMKKESDRAASWTLDGNAFLAQSKTFMAQNDADLKKKIKEAKSLDLLEAMGVDKSTFNPEVNFTQGADAQFDYAAEVKKAREDYPALRKRLKINDALKLPGEGGK